MVWPGCLLPAHPLTPQNQPGAYSLTHQSLSCLCILAHGILCAWDFIFLDGNFTTGMLLAFLPEQTMTELMFVYLGPLPSSLHTCVTIGGEGSRALMSWWSKWEEQLWLVCSVVRLSAHGPKGCGFNSPSRAPTYLSCRFGPWPCPGQGMCGRQLIDASLWHRCVFFPLSPLLLPPFHSVWKAMKEISSGGD